MIECQDPSLFEEWLQHWSDPGAFEVHPVIDSAETARRVDVSWADPSH